MTLGAQIAWDDTILPFQLDKADIRGRVARVDGVLDSVLAQHRYPDPIEALVAEALLFPIDWPEPFGLVVIEAMALGIPVIAWREGAMPEIVDHGETGFLVDSIDDAVAAVGRCGDLDRAHIRSTFERRFSDQRMVRDYERLYAELLDETPEWSFSHRPSTSGTSILP